MYEKLLIENLIESYNAEKDEIRRKLDRLPKGYLKIINNSGYSQWHVIFKGNASSIGRSRGWKLINKTRTSEGVAYEFYLPKKERAFAADLALREYYERRLADIARAMNSITCNFTGTATRVNAARIEAPGYFSCSFWRNTQFSEEKTQLIREQLDEKEGELNKWMHEEYPSNPKHPERLIFKSACGIMMRSRVEVVIANLLTQYGIPFRYEEKFEGVNGESFYPDFHIIHPITGKEYVWEHHGILDSSRYIEEAVWKYNNLIHLGFIPGDTLLLTGETGENQVNMNAIMATVLYIVKDVDGMKDNIA